MKNTNPGDKPLISSNPAIQDKIPLFINSEQDCPFEVRFESELNEYFNLPRGTKGTTDNRELNCLFQQRPERSRDNNYPYVFPGLVLLTGIRRCPKQLCRKANFDAKRLKAWNRRRKLRYAVSKRVSGQSATIFSQVWPWVLPLNQITSYLFPRIIHAALETGLSKSNLQTPEQYKSVFESAIFRKKPTLMVQVLEISSLEASSEQGSQCERLKNKLQKMKRRNLRKSLIRFQLLNFPLAASVYQYIVYSEKWNIFYKNANL